MKTLIIAGGSGYLGKVLVNYFKDTVEHIYVLTRSQTTNHENISYLTWDATSIGEWATVFEGADVLINLTGKSVDCRYNQKKQRSNFVFSYRFNKNFRSGY